MTKTERVRAAVTGQKPDKLPYSFWSHLPGIDLDPVALAENTYKFYKDYDIDVIKTMDNGMYCVEDFGCKADYSEIKGGGAAKLAESPIQTAADYLKLKVCSPEEGALARELKALKLLLELLKKNNEDVPVIFTVFSPMTILDKLSVKKVHQHIADGKEKEILFALEVITETTCALAKRAIELGAAGIFFATQMNHKAMSEADYLKYGKPFDLRVLEAAKDGWLNTLHAHGDDIMFEILSDYPVQVFNWHAWETLPDIDEAHEITGKCLMGGLQRYDITDCHKNAVMNQIYKCLKISGGKNLILTPGCVIRYPLNDEMLAFVRQAKESIEAKIMK